MNARIFDGLHLSGDADVGTTTIAGPVTGQAALHGLLVKAGDLGLPLLAVRRIRPRLTPTPGRGELGVFPVRAQPKGDRSWRRIAPDLLWAEAVTPETQTAAAAHDGFVTYDELRGPDLDAARWSPARLPLPTGGEHLPLDPNAELTVGDGEVRVTIPRFSLSHDTFQPADSAKYLIFSTRQFELPPDRPATFAVDLAVNNIGGEPGDYRQGMAAFHAFDFEVSRRVFAVCGTSTRVFALHEQLGAWGAGEPFYHVIESPYEDFDDDFTRLRACEVTLDRGRSTAAWRVDGHPVYQTHGTFIPERVRLGFGIWTMLPLRDGRSRSLDGQGLHARWRRFRVRGVDA